jgi:cellobiose-specific phosphotransferase system component IIA
MAESASIMELHTMLVDTCKGYDAAIQAAEKPQLKALFEKAKSVLEKAHAEVHAILRARAANPDYEASFLTPVHKVAISTHACDVLQRQKSLFVEFAGELQRESTP